MNSINLKEHPYFTGYTDPVSGVRSYILTEKPAPCIQNFYFVNSGMAENSKYFWFYCAYPPGAMHCLGVLGTDAEKPFVRCFPAAQFERESPWVSPDGREAFYTYKENMYKINIEGSIEVFATLPEELVRGRTVFDMCTHITRSADEKYFLLDVNVGNEWAITLLDIKTREFKTLCRFGGKHNHVQFSYTNPKEFIVDEDWWFDPITGQRFSYHHRIWLMDTEQSCYRPVEPEKWFEHNSLVTHDFWSKDGYVCWVDHKLGAFEYHPEARKIQNVWKRSLCHAHCNADRSLWCADESPYLWAEKPCKLLFYNRQTGREAEIYSAMPNATVSRGVYHSDPHPSFTPDGKFIAATTTVRGEMDVSLTPVEQLVEMTKGDR